jgi:xanthine dehydrogenase accessory factor
MEQQLNKIPPDKDTYIVIVTRAHKNDAEALEACINRPFNYIGMIGSKRKVALIRDNFIKSGISSAEEFDKVFSPIGVNIGALTVPEIATSITAELIAVRRKKITHKPWTDRETR